MWLLAPLVKFAISAGYVVLANGLLNRRSYRALAIVWFVAAAGQGFAEFLLTCSTPLTCDAGDPSSYLVRLWPLFALVGTLTFGAAVLAAQTLAQPSGAGLRARPLIIGALAVFGAWLLATSVVGGVWAWQAAG